MNDSPLFLALDQGGHSSRAIVFDTAGRVVSRAQIPIQTFNIGDGRIEHSADELVDSIVRAARNALHELGWRVNRVVRAALATQRSSVVCWNRHTTRALSPVLSWQDTRAAERLMHLNARRSELHNLTGLFPSPHYGASKLEWCLENIPPVWDAARNDELACGPLASFLVARLSDSHASIVDPANAGRTLLWNIDKQDWDDSLLQEFGLQRRWLPACKATVGELAMLSLSGRDIPLGALNGDQSAALFSDGVPGESDVFVNAGTGAFIQRVTSVRPSGVDRLPLSVVVRDEHTTRYALEGTVNGAAAALDWVALHEKLNDWPRHAQAWLAAVTDPPLFINGVGGVGSPYWLPNIESDFIGAGDGVARWVGALESIVFLLRVNFDELNRALGSAERIVLSGGLAHIDGFCQRLADLCGLPVTRSEFTEATARGVACLLQAGYRWSQGDTPTLKIFEPTLNAAIELRFERWCREMDRL